MSNYLVGIEPIFFDDNGSQSYIQSIDDMLRFIDERISGLRNIINDDMMSNHVDADKNSFIYGKIDCLNDMQQILKSWESSIYKYYKAINTHH